MAEDWTFETLRAHLCMKIAALEALVDERFKGSDKFNESILNEKVWRLEQRFNLNDRAVESAFLTAKEALSKAETASITGFEKSNEWRSSLNDVMQTRLARSEYLSEHNALKEKVDLLISRLDTYQGARPVADKGTWRDILTVVAVLVSIAALLVVYTSGIHH